MKRRLFLLCTLFLIALAAQAQNSVDDYVQKGIEYHDAGKYMKAIEMYKKALEIDPKSPAANYEICYSLLALKDYSGAIKYANKVIAMNNDYSIQGYIIKGTAYDDSGNPKKAVKVYQDGIKKYGQHYLLCYNLAVTMVSLKDYNKAEESLSNGLHSKPNHPGSNLLLSYINLDKSRKVEGLLALHYFLVNESGTDRSKQAAKTLIETYRGMASVSEGDSGKMKINITMSPINKKDGLNLKDMLFSIAVGKNLLDSSKTKSKVSLFMANTRSLVYLMLGKSEDKDDDDAIEEAAKNISKSEDIYMTLYTAFLSKVILSDHFETYCYYIMSGADKEAARWIEENPGKVSELAEWFRSME